MLSLKKRVSKKVMLTIVFLNFTSHIAQDILNRKTEEAIIWKRGKDLVDINGKME